MNLRAHAKIALGYAGCAALWILGSDLALGAWSGGDLHAQWLATLKGMVFVAVTALILFALLRRLDRRARDRYHQLFDHHPAAMLMVDGHRGRIVDANPAACAFYGWPREQLCAMAMADINQLQPEECELELGAARDGAGKVFHFRHRLASGEVRDVEVRSGLVSHDGQPLLCLIVHDETDRLRAAASQRQLEALSAAAVDISQAMVGAVDQGPLLHDVCRAAIERTALRMAWIAWVDGGGQLNLVSQAGEPAAAIEAAQLVGAALVQQALRDGRPAVSADCQALPVDDAWRDWALAQGIASSAVLPIRRAGQLVALLGLHAPTAQYFSEAVLHLLDRLAQGLGRTLESLDQRGRERRAASAVTQAEERWRLALAGGGHAVWEWDAKSSCVFFSDAWKAMLGYAPEDIGGTLQEWRSRIHPDDLARVDLELARHFAGETPMYSCEHRLRCKDGSYKWICDRGRVIARDPLGAPLTVIGTHTERTDLLQQAGSADAVDDAALQATGADLGSPKPASAA